jgi:hypothetical protein
MIRTVLKPRGRTGGTGGMYQLLFLVLLTNGLVTPSGLNLQDKYLTMFCKRMIALINSEPPTDLEDAFYRCIGHVKVIGELTSKYFNMP